ncbi:MAG: hypothetical protein IAE89_10105 [Anaerolineae bacterium]|nr:hypothetical protein [Anaerolineae bacterium]
MSRIIGLLATALAISSGLIMLIGLATGALSSLTNLLLQITIITAGMAMIIGVINLLSVHLRRIIGRERGLLYSVALVLSFLLVIALYVLGADAERRILLRDVEGSIESALAALLVFALVYGAYRLMRRGVTWAALLFTLALLITLLGALPFSQLSVMSEIRAWMVAVPASAGARGLLIGIALAAVVTGMRALIGQERAYRE